MKEWRDPLWGIRFLFPARCILFSLGIASTTARADIRHSVFDLNPGLTYDVYVGGQLIFDDASPTPSGDLTFTASVSGPVRLVPNGAPHFAGATASCTAGFSVSFPNPNPTNGAFELQVRLDRASDLRVRVIEAAAGRERLRERFVLPPGEHALRLAMPPRTASGLYLVRIEGGPASVVRKVVLLRDVGR